MAAQRQRQLAGVDAVAVVRELVDNALDAGRSTISPAAIWLTSSSGSSRIGRRAAGGNGRLIAEF